MSLSTKTIAQRLACLPKLNSCASEHLPERKLRTLTRVLVSFFAVFLVPATLMAQVPDPINAAQAPIPGSEHHYIGMGAETVNPADGSVSFNLPVQLPPGRGMSMPFGVRYSGPEHRYIWNGGSGSNVSWAQWDMNGTKLQIGGWSYQLPWLTSQSREVAEATNQSTHQTAVCIGAGAYVFHGLDFAERTLNLFDMYEDPQHNPFHLCDSTIQSTSDLHGIVATSTDLATWQSTSFPCSPAVNVVDQSGTTYQFAGAGLCLQGIIGYPPAYHFGQLAQSITDRNGNQITLNANGKGYTDALAGCGKSRFGKRVRKTNRTQLPQEREMGRG
jgi:hypothetical protein